MRLMIIVLIAAIILCACGQTNSINAADLPEPFFEGLWLSAYKLHNEYYVCYSEEYIRHDKKDKFEKYLVFSEDRQLLKSVGFDFYLIDLNTVILENGIQVFLGNTQEEWEAVLGKCHVDEGSGFYKPCYITTDAYLLKFCVYDGEVGIVALIDLLTGEKIEEYFQ